MSWFVRASSLLPVEVGWIPPWHVTPAVALAALTIAAGTVGIVRRYALERDVLDIPSERSSHRVPTPRGGGLGLVLAVCLTGAGALFAQHLLPGIVVLLGAAAVTAVAVVGWVDDHRGLDVRTRLTVHVGAGVVTAALALASRRVELGGAPGWVYALAAGWWAFWAVSAINVVNFMDGIDGLIASQMLIYATFVAALAPAGGAAQVLAVSVAGASGGFLTWNWSPARIFLGDVGSGACGLLAVLCGLLLIRDAGVPLARAYLPLYPLFLDAAVTLGRRLRAGERISTPHRSHLYQRLANGPWTHARTALVFAAAAAVGAAVGAAAGRATAAGSAAAVAAYLVVVLLAGRRLEREAPWRPTAPRPTAPRPTAPRPTAPPAA